MPKPMAKIKLTLAIVILLAALLPADPVVAKTPATADLRESAVVRAVRTISPAVVNISSHRQMRKRANPFTGFDFHPFFDSFFKDFFDPDFENRTQRSSLGSGVIIDGKRGFILTNNHVIENTGIITVVLKDEREFEAQIVGADPDSDLAVLKIESRSPLPSIKMGTVDDLMIGETVIAIGNPFGFSHTVTTGVISALNRSVRTEKHVYRDFIQTDASINPGNSGGPLLNINGDLIGINTAVYAKAQGIGFAIPISRAQKIISDLIKFGEVVTAWIGVQVQPLDADLARYLNLPQNNEGRLNGALVQNVLPESPAAKVGIRNGDVILDIGGRAVSSPSDYNNAMRQFAAGDRLKLTIWRQAGEQTIMVTADVFPESLSETLALQLLGIQIDDLTTENRLEFKSLAKEGVIITAIDRRYYLARIGVRPGDIIRKIDDIPIKKRTDFRRALAKYRVKNSVVLLVQRADQLYYITVRL